MFSIESLHSLTFFMLGKFLMLLLSSADFFKIINFKKKSGTLSKCQMVWIQIRTNILLVLIWVQTVCKGYQQMTKVATSKERFKCNKIMFTPPSLPIPPPIFFLLTCNSSLVASIYNQSVKKVDPDLIQGLHRLEST